MAKVAKKLESKTELTAVPQQENVPAIAGAPAGWGSEGVQASDILIPKLLVMQGLSKLVADGQAHVGQIRDSLNGELLGGKEKAMEVIAFSSFRTWVIFEKRNGKDEYVKTERITAENENWPINEVVGGVEVRRDKCLNFYVIRPEEIKQGMAFPYLISFRRTSMQAGKKLSTFAAKLNAFKLPLASKVINLSVTAQENDKGKFFVFDVAMGRAASTAEVQEAFKWYQTLQTAQVRHDDSDLKGNESPAPASYDSEENTNF